MAESVTEYWEEQTRRVIEGTFGLPHEPDFHSAVTLIGDDQRRGWVDSRVFFAESIILDVHEKVAITLNGVARRRRYSYQLVVYGIEGIRWNYDPYIPEEFRTHIDDPTRDWHWRPDERRRLPEVIRLCWDSEIDRLTTMVEIGDIETP